MNTVKTGVDNMAGSERKKMSNIYILEILRRHTDGSIDSKGNPRHCMTQAEIREKLEEDYDITLDRKAVSRGLEDLISAVPEISEKIEFDTTVKKGRDGVPYEEKTNFRYCHEFDDDQVRLLTEAILFSKNIPQTEAQEMIAKLSALGGLKSGKKLSKNLCKLKTVSQDKVTNQQIINNIGIIDEAIEKGRQISFIYNDYGTDKKLHPRKLLDGEPMRREASPYSIVVGNERYYLVCNYSEYDNALRIRIDKMTGIEILRAASKPKRSVRGLKEEAYSLAELLYMQPGEPERTVLRVNKRIVSDIVDWFGKGVRFGEEDENNIVCEIKAVPKSIKFWAMQYCEYVEVLEPESLREDIKASMRGAWRKYDDSNSSISDASGVIDKLCDSWQKICDNAPAGILDIKELEETVKRTHSLLLPFRGGEIGDSYYKLIYKMNDYVRNVRRVHAAKAHAVALLIDGILKDLKYADKYASSKIPDNIIPLRYLHESEGITQLYFEFDTNNFEDDFLTLLHYTEIDADRYEKWRTENAAEMNKKVKQRMAERRNKTGG